MQARLIFNRIESADKWENFPEHFEPMPPPQSVSLQFRKGNVPFRSRAVPLYSRRAYSRARLTASNKPVFCAALSLSTRISPLNFAHGANGAVFRFSIMTGRFYDDDDGAYVVSLDRQSIFSIDIQLVQSIVQSIIKRDIAHRRNDISLSI